MSFRISLFVLVLSLSTVFVFAGGQGEAATDGEIVLEFITDQVGEGDPGAVALANRIEEFNTEFEGSIQVEIVAIPEHTQMKNRIQTNVASDTPMDLFWLIDDIRAEEFWAEGYLADLTPYIDDEFRSWKTEEHWAEVTDDGAIRGVPYFSTLIGIYYNKDIFAEAGVEAPLETWDEFFEAAERIKDAGYVPMTLDTLNTAWLTMLNYSAYVGGILGPDYLQGRETFSDPAFYEGAEFLQRMLDYTTDDVVGVIYNVAANYFIQGQAAMIPNGGWMIGQFPEDFADNVGVMPFPGHAGTSGPIVIDGPIAKLLTSHHHEENPERLEAIVTFMEWFSRPDNIKRMIIESGLSYTGTVTFDAEDEINPILAELFNSASVADYSIPRIRDTVPAGFYSGFEEEIAKYWNGNTTTDEFIENLNEKTFEN
jgi:raffinose/stachyose/melibiose transport system substrate-binding protein